MKTLLTTAFSLVVLFAAHPLLAKEKYVSKDRYLGESPQNVALEFRVGPYSPDIDSEFKGQGPYAKIFGDDPAWLFGLELDWQILKKSGTLGIFGSAMIGRVAGYGWDPESDAASEDETKLFLLPCVFGAVYRADQLAKRWNVPLVFSFKFGLSYTFWWITNGVGDVTSYEPEGGGDKIPGYGGTWGLAWGAGLHFLLDVLEPHVSKVFDNEMGVNNTYLYVEYSGFWSNDFGSDDSWNLSNHGVVFGLAFEM
jgi:hypothetical protein